jgi:hypothetical protein
LLLAIPLLIHFFLANTLAALIVYGSSIFAVSSASGLTKVTSYGAPVWGFWSGAIVLPFRVGIVEELTYRDSAPPRFVALNAR